VDITLSGAGITVLTRANVTLPGTVGWEYADPSGHRHEVVNCSVAKAIAELFLELRRPLASHQGQLGPEPESRSAERGGPARAEPPVTTGRPWGARFRA
jgi:hypothetical protein